MLSPNIKTYHEQTTFDVQSLATRTGFKYLSPNSYKEYYEKE